MLDRSMPTPTQLLAGALIGQPVTDWITAQRQAGRPWRFIARDLAEATDGQIDVTVQTLHNWMREAASAERAA